MAGHSHWAGIKHKKALVDAKKGKIFTKIARRIIVAAREGGGDPDGNLKLQYAILDAKRANMPGDNIERAIKRGTGEGSTAIFHHVNYEGYAPGGVAILVDATTDNKNRTVSELRNIIEKRGGKLGEAGCVAWMFEKRGVLGFPSDSVPEDRILEAGLDVGVEDIRTEGSQRFAYCDSKRLETVRQTLEKSGLVPESVEIQFVPQSRITLDSETARKVLDLCEEIDDHDDVQNVYANFDIPEDVLRQLQVAESRN